jgi:RNA polymerase sigma-70 factor (ECF subfamily)
MNLAHAEPPTFNAALLMAAPAIAREPELADLLSLMAGGDQRAFERFYKQTVSRVFGLALRIVRCRATAEEVAENVYVQIWHSAASYDAQRGTPIGWALTICRSRALDALRRADRALVDPDPTERIDAVSEAVPDLQDLLEASQQHAALHAAMARLRPEQRQMLCLAFFRGMTHQEIAAASHLPLGTVKSAIRRSLKVLREELGTD